LILFATEVGDEIAYSKLPAKSQSIQNGGPQLVPQYSFRISLIATQLTRAMKISAVRRESRSKSGPLPYPLLGQGEGQKFD